MKIGNDNVINRKQDPCDTRFKEEAEYRIKEGKEVEEDRPMEPDSVSNKQRIDQ